MVHFAVSGSARLFHAAELAEVTLLVQASGPEREPVRSVVAGAQRAVTEEIAELHRSGAVDQWAADDLLVRSVDEWVGEDLPRRTVQRASARITARFCDLGLLNTWLSNWGARELLTLWGIEWTLTEQTRARLLTQVRQDALLDALQRARDYAETLKLPEPQLRAIYEPGLRPNVGDDGQIQSGRMYGAAMRSAAAEDAAPEFDLTPPTQEQAAAISADFEA